VDGVGGLVVGAAGAVVVYQSLGSCCMFGCGWVHPLEDPTGPTSRARRGWTQVVVKHCTTCSDMSVIRHESWGPGWLV
jgi:hypothetical protein